MDIKMVLTSTKYMKISRDLYKYRKMVVRKTSLKKEHYNIGDRRL